MRLFCGILDQAGINSGVLFQMVKRGRQKCIRRHYLFELEIQLARAHMERHSTKTLPKKLSFAIRNILGKEEENVAPASLPPKLAKQTRCPICPRTSDRKTKIVCVKCFSTYFVCTYYYCYSLIA